MSSIKHLAIQSESQQIDNNLDSKSIANVLNFFLFQAFKSVFFSTNLVEVVFTSLLTMSYADNRRKISILDKEDVAEILYKIVIFDDKQEKWDLFTKLELERTIPYDIIRLFLTITKHYLSYEEQYIKTNKRFYSDKMAAIETILKTTRAHCAPAIRWSQAYIKYYDEFKSSIIQKYIRLAATEAIKSSYNTSLEIDIQELFDNLTLSMQKSIDKFNPNKGTITNYIKVWFKDAKTNPEFDHEYNKAYSISNVKRREIRDNKDYRQVNLSQQLDVTKGHGDANEGLSLEDMIIQNDKRDQITRIINKTKSTRFVRLLSDIPYVLSKEEIQLFQSQWI